MIINFLLTSLYKKLQKLINNFQTQNHESLVKLCIFTGWYRIIIHWLQKYILFKNQIVYWSFIWSWAIASNFLRGALNFCFLLRSYTAWRTDSIWEDYCSAQMYNTVCWPKQSVSVPFALYIKKNCWNYSTSRIIL